MVATVQVETDLNGQVVAIANTKIEMMSWGIASRLAIMLGDPKHEGSIEGLTLKHMLALAYQMGVDSSKSKILGANIGYGNRLRSHIRSVEEILDGMRALIKDEGV